MGTQHEGGKEMSLNRVTLIGHLGQDPELRHLPTSGQPVASFSIATDEAYTDKQGQRQERVDWHNIVVFGKAAESCKEYLKKGREVVCCESFIGDGGGPPGVGLQEQIPNHHKLRG
jgi:Single-strand binding protein family